MSGQPLELCSARSTHRHPADPGAPAVTGRSPPPAPSTVSFKALHRAIPWAILDPGLETDTARGMSRACGAFSGRPRTSGPPLASHSQTCSFSLLLAMALCGRSPYSHLALFQSLTKPPVLVSFVQPSLPFVFCSVSALRGHVGEGWHYTPFQLMEGKNVFTQKCWVGRGL